MNVPDELTPHVLTYAAPSKRSGRSIKFLLVASVLLIGMYYLGLVSSGSAETLDDWRAVSIAEVIASVGRISPLDALMDRHLHDRLWFLPLSAIALAAFVVARSPRVRIAVAVIAGVSPFVVLLWTYGWKAMILPVVVVPAVVGYCDGETWSDGIVADSAIACWTILWLVMLVGRWPWRAESRDGYIVGDGHGTARQLGVFDEVTNKGKGPSNVKIGEVGEDEPLELD